MAVLDPLIDFTSVEISDDHANHRYNAKSQHFIVACLRKKIAPEFRVTNAANFWPAKLFILALIRFCCSGVNVRGALNFSSSNFASCARACASAMSLPNLNIPFVVFRFLHLGYVGVCDLAFFPGAGFALFASLAMNLLLGSSHLSTRTESAS